MVIACVFFLGDYSLYNNKKGPALLGLYGSLCPGFSKAII